MEKCINHNHINAEFCCEWCNGYFCQDCIEFKHYSMDPLSVCKCGGRAIPVQAVKVQKNDHSTDFLPVESIALTDSFTYALRGHGPWLIGVGIAFTIIMDLLMFPFLFLFMLGYLMAYSKKMVLHSSEGNREMPGWPDITTIIDDILIPFGQWLICILISLSPYILVHIYIDNLFISIIALLIGSFYLPISLLSVSIHNSAITAFNFHILIPSISKIGIDYLLVSLFMFVALFTMILGGFVFSFLPLIGIILSKIISFYCLITTMNMIGLMYYRHEEKLDWF